MINMIRFLEVNNEQITDATLLVFIFSFASMLIAQFAKLVIYSIRDRKLNLKMFISTGGFPSSHTAFCISLCILLGMTQWRYLERLDWSFALALVFSMIVIHDAMGVRLEASKHAKILNRMADEEGLSQAERIELGYGKKGNLKEMLGHRGVEVLSGAIVGLIVGFIGFIIITAIL